MMLLKPCKLCKKKLTGAIIKSKWLGFISLILLSQVLNAQAPVAQFTASPTSGCSPLTVRFTDQSSGSPVFWNWDLGNGQLSTQQNPVATYTTPGSYTVTLVVRNASGINSVTKTNFIVVNQAPTADFSANTTTACLPATIQFTDISIPNVGTITQWSWDFGDGGTSTQKNPTHQYAATGFYTVTLRVTSSSGCQAAVSKGNYIRIVSGVTADFSFTGPTTCSSPFQVTFNNLTSGPGSLSYQWDLGNSTTSTQINPTTTYPSQGTYTIRLRATSQFGCSDSVQKNFTIPAITTAITAPDTVCLGVSVNFQNNSVPAPSSTLWDFGNGVQSVKFADTTSFNTPGVYRVKLINVYSSCTDSAFKDVVVRPNPFVDFTATNLAACRSPLTVNFQDLSPDAVGWLWDFGDGGTSTQKNPSHQYNSNGQFTVKLTITDGKACQNTITKTSFVQIVSPTVAIANAPTGGCAPFTFNPIANVNTIDGIASYFWDFGDGFTSTAPNPSHTYAAIGNYNIKLRITTNGGCSDSIVVASGVRVGNPPVADFTASPLSVCASGSVSFTDLSTGADEWLWDFGDGTTSTQQNPTHNFSDTGVFSITLTAFSNKCGQPITRAGYVRVLPPIAAFNYSVQCSNKRQVNFTNNSKTDPAYGPITYLWEFGDPGNSNSNQPNPTFTYPAPGTYTVRLTVTNGSCSYTFTQTLNLNNDVADFTVSKSTACKNEIITFTAINSSPANIVKYEWSFDGSPYINYGPVVTNYYSINGPHSVSLIITDRNGCTDTLTNPLSVTIIGATAGFNTPTIGGCKNGAVSFNDLSSPSSSIVKWTWDFGDGSSQEFTSPPFSHVYSDTGRFTVKLTIQDNNGCIDTITGANAVLITSPRAFFFADTLTICAGAPVQFSDSSVGYGLTYSWNFGDGGTSTLKSPQHRYSGRDSSYTVTLTITDTVGCKDSLSRQAYILVRSPKPSFTVTDTSTICPPLETKFTFQGRDYESFYWDFGDGSTSTLTNPRHFYNSYGSYTAKLYLTGYGGCLDSASAVINVYDPNLSSSISYSPLQGCNFLLVDFTITTPPHTSFTFFGGDGFIDSTSQNKNFQHLYNSFGFFNPFIVMKDSFGCLVSQRDTALIRVIGAEPLFGIDKKAFCDTGTVLFANFSIGNDTIVNTVWNFGDGNTSNVSDPSHRYNTPGTYFPSLTVTTQSGCTKTLNDTVRVYRTPLPSIDGDSVVCINELLTLSGLLAQPDTAITWAWNFGNGSSSNQQNPTTSYNSAGSFTITLETANKLGCKSNSSKNVLVPPLPVINVLGNPTIPVGTGINLPITYGPNIATYNWSPPRNLSCLDCPVPFANPKSTTKYKVDITDIYGCTSSGELTVIVVCNEQNFFIPNTFSPNNDGNNDVFYPRGSGIARIQSMRIFNRWGELVFERRNFAANDPAMGWNGMHKGKKAETDAYVYVIELVCENSVIIPYKGNVTLIR